MAKDIILEMDCFGSAKLLVFSNPLFVW